MSSKKGSKKSLMDYFKPAGGKSKKKEEDDPIEIEEAAVVEEGVEEVMEEKPSPALEVVTNGRRPTRACANKARVAWNDREPSISSSESEDDELPRSARKRKTRASIQNSAKRNKQTTLSTSGKIINKENKDSKKKAKVVDPEREAFLRSGVPDVIEKAKARAGKNTVVTLDDDEEEVEPEKEKRKILDPDTLAFLNSGIPESIRKVRQSVDKRKEENDSLISMGFFPKISHTSLTEEDDDASSSETSDVTETACKFALKASLSQSLSEFIGDLPVEHLELTFNILKSSGFSCLSSQESDLFHPVGLCCDDNSVRVSFEPVDSTSRMRMSNKKEDDYDCRPWIEAMKVTKVKDLVVDTNGMDTLMKWLKQWRSDIKDDGGTSRKWETKKKRGNGSDSDFITSGEEESEMKKKSVLLTGPSGCGKTAAVYVLAKHYDFAVVEVNFSSRRSGKDVLQRVEEAVLSHRLKSSHNCLLVFKDIDLFHPEEDEGFFSAVAQLITTAVRPIVMTSSLPAYCIIDSRLEKKDPLRIDFTFPKPRDIVEKILKPMLASTKSSVESDILGNVDLWLDSIVRHSGCDIRQCINQLQLLLSTSMRSLKPKCLSNTDIHLYSSPFLLNSVDLNFPRQGLVLGLECNSAESGISQDDDDEVNMSLSARRKQSHNQLEKLSQNLEVFADLDWISCPPSSFSTLNSNIFGDVDEAKWQWNHVSGFRSPFFTRLSSVLRDSKRNSKDLKLTRELVLESDAEIDKWMGISVLSDDIKQYCGPGEEGSEWESAAAVRTIVKNNMLDKAVGRVQKRHGRMASYFNRIDKGLLDKISNTFDFQSKLDSVKLYN